jgi:hypothetical protein
MSLFEPKQFWPISLTERNFLGHLHIGPEDIADFAWPPGRKDRYTEIGWEKVIRIGIGPVDVRDFGVRP